MKEKLRDELGTHRWTTGKAIDVVASVELLLFVAIVLGAVICTIFL